MDQSSSACVLEMLKIQDAPLVTWYYYTALLYETETKLKILKWKLPKSSIPLSATVMIHPQWGTCISSGSLSYEKIVNYNQ